jgi:porphobilinogen synthase
LRGLPALRELVAETRLHPSQFVMPLFVRQGRGEGRPIDAMPGQFQWPVDSAAARVKSLRGASGVLLFGIPARKDARGSSAYDPAGVVPNAIRAIKKVRPDLCVMADVCLCEYTDHGHCGVLRAKAVDNDATVELLGRAAVAYAAAGADVVAPSAMMDGQVRRIREALDSEGLGHVAIMSYSAKYASGFYGPFREAAHSKPAFGDRAAYQMDLRNRREAMREIRLDIDEGADIVMVKPALAYLDVISEARRRFSTPLAAYCVSGEYSMVKAAAEKGWLQERRIALEILNSIRRAGADLIISYWAESIFDWLVVRPH